MMSEETVAVQPETYTPIDIRLLANKVSPVLGRLVPGFLYRHFEKLLHLEDLNQFFEAHFNDTPEQFLDAVVEHLDIRVKVEGKGEVYLDSLVDQKPMFASNHPYGGPEAMVLFNILIRRFPDCRLVAQSFLKFIKPVASSCVFNKKDVRSLMEAIDQKRPLLIYPAGFCSRRLSFKDVFDYEWKHSFVKIARRNNMPIQVFYTSGQLSNRMHRWTRFRKIFHIKFTIETMYLVDEMYKMRGKELRIVVGDTIDPAKMNPKVSHHEYAARIRQYCYELKNNPNATFDYEKPATLPLV